MLITPQELIDYTEFQAVKKRPAALLEKDIIEAQAEIEEIAGHDFSDSEYTPLPEKVQLAMLKMAQFYALINADEALVKGYESEKIGDYSYKLPGGVPFRKPDVSTLLKTYIKADLPAPIAQSVARLRMRSI